MRRKNPGVVFAVLLAIAAMPLACGDDEASSDGGGNGSGARATGGSGATAGQGAAGIGGEETGGGKATSGGTGGTSGRGGSAGAGNTAGAAGSAGGASGIAGEGGGSGASDGGVGVAPGGGEGGEGFSNEFIELAKRICNKTEALNCADYSTCVEDFHWLFFGSPQCGPVAERMLICLDTQATIEDFTCADGKPTAIDRGAVNPCNYEWIAVSNSYCF